MYYIHSSSEKYASLTLGTNTAGAYLSVTLQNLFLAWNKNLTFSARACKIPNLPHTYPGASIVKDINMRQGFQSFRSQMLIITNAILILAYSINVGKWKLKQELLIYLFLREKCHSNTAHSELFQDISRNPLEERKTKQTNKKIFSIIITRWFCRACLLGTAF